MGVFPQGHVQKAHLRMLVASFWTALGGGIASSFAVYSVTFHDGFGLTQDQIAILRMAHVAVSLVSCSCGLLVDFVGVTLCLVLGCVLNAGTWFIFGAIAWNGSTAWPPSLTFAMLAAAATFGAACISAATFSALVRNFPEERGAAIGIAKAWGGIASSVVLTTFMSFANPAAGSGANPGHLCWLVASSIVLLTLVPAPLMQVLGGGSMVPLKARPFPPCSPHWKQLRLLGATTLALVVVTALASMLKDNVPWGLEAMLTGSMVTGIFSPAYLLLISGGLGGLAEQPTESAAEAMATHAQANSSGSASGPAAHGAAPAFRAAPSPASSRPASSSSGGAPAPERAPWQCGPLGIVARPEAWLLGLAVLALQGGGSVLNLNMGNLLERHKASHATAQVQALVLSGCAQSLGSIFGGMCSDVAVQWRIARPWCLVVALVSMGAAHLLLWIAGHPIVPLAVVLAGLAFGSTFPIMMAIVAELFGTAYVATNFMAFDGISEAISAMLASHMFNRSYRAVLLPDSLPGNGNGANRIAFAGIAALQVAAVLGAMRLAGSSAAAYRDSVWPQLCGDEPADSGA